MQVSLNIDFDQLIRIIQNLPDDKKAAVKSSLEDHNRNTTKKSKTDFRKFLLKAPVMSDEEYAIFFENRKKFDQCFMMPRQ